MPPFLSRQRPLLVAVFILTVVLVIFAQLINKPSDQELNAAEAPNLAVITTTAKLQPIYPQQRAYLGRIEAPQQSELGFELSGRIDTLLVSEGDPVTAGQPLAKLDTALLQNRQTSLAAALEVATAQSRLADLALQRERDTFARQLSSQQALDTAVATASSAAARRRAVAADLAAVATQIDKSTLRAPYAGIIADRFLDDGSVVAAGAPLLKLLAGGGAELKATVAAAALPALTVGDRYQVQLGDQLLDATLAAIAPKSTARTRGTTVVLDLDLPIGAVQHGATATLLIDQQIERAAFALPLAALTESVRGIWAVYAAVSETDSGEQRLQRRQVELLHQSGETVFVRGDIADGDTIVISGLHRLVPGQLVHTKAGGTDE